MIENIVLLLIFIIMVKNFVSHFLAPNHQTSFFDDTILMTIAIVTACFSLYQILFEDHYELLTFFLLVLYLLTIHLTTYKAQFKTILSPSSRAKENSQVFIWLMPFVFLTLIVSILFIKNNPDPVTKDNVFKSAAVSVAETHNLKLGNTAFNLNKLLFEQQRAQDVRAVSSNAKHENKHSDITQKKAPTEMSLQRNTILVSNEESVDLIELIIAITLYLFTSIINIFIDRYMKGKSLLFYISLAGGALAFCFFIAYVFIGNISYTGIFVASRFTNLIRK